MVYKFKSHTADVMFEAKGKTLEKLLESCVKALLEAIKKGIKIKTKKKVKIRVKASDHEDLVYKLLEEILFLFDAKSFIGEKIKITSLKENKLEAELLGDYTENYKISNEVKAVTYSQMKIEKRKKEYIARVVLDV